MLDGEVALVTGAGGGIGCEVAAALRHAGASVVLSDIAAEPLAAAAARLGEERVLARAFDATRAAEVEALVDEAEALLGRVSILVNCIGAFRVCDFERITDEDWADALAANLTAVFLTCRTVGRRMRERRRGAIVNVASAAGEYGSVRPAAHYAAAKGGVIALSKSLARELSPSGVRVNVVSPGPIDTPALQVATDEERAAAAARTLVGRLGTPADIAAAVLYLAGPHAGYVTGEVLRVNGGSLL